MLEVFYCQATDQDGDDCSVVLAASSYDEALRIWRDHHQWYEAVVASDDDQAYRGPLDVQILKLARRDTPGVLDWEMIDHESRFYNRDGTTWIVREQFDREFAWRG